MTAVDHNKILGILFFIKGGLLTVSAVLIVVIYGLFGAIFGAAMMSSGKGQEKLVGGAVGGAFVVFAVALGLAILVFAGLYLMAGWKLTKLQPSARIWTIIASCLALFSFPLGTALGIYGLWFMFGDQGQQLYSGGAQNAHPPQQPNQPPPPPHSWQ